MQGLATQSGGRKRVYLYVLGGSEGSAENIDYFVRKRFWLIQNS